MEIATLTLLTGATSSIGRAIARRLSVSQRLILHGRDAARLEETRQACHHPDNHLAWSQDLADAAGAAVSLENFLRCSSVAVDGFVHCAGMAGLLPARAADYQTVQTSLNVNFVSAQQIVAALLKKKINAGALRGIVAISSVSSLFGVKGYSVYGASKAALNAWVRALAVELAPDVRVNSVVPGAVLTATTEVALSDPALAERIAGEYPLGVGKPDDVAAVVEFLLSENARWLTGQEIVVDGGFSVNGTA